MIIGLNGFAGSGKDTLAKSLILRHDFVRVSFADKLKDVAYTSNPWIKWNDDNERSARGYYRLQDAVSLHGWDYVKYNSDARDYLQNLGQGGRETLGEFVWVGACYREVSQALSVGKNVVFTDMRYRNEYQYILDLGGVTVAIDRPGVGPANGHVSEADLSDVPFDFVVVNDGSLQDLANKATKLYQAILDKEHPSL